MMKQEPTGTWYSIEGINPEPWESPIASIIRKAGKFIPHLRSSDRLRFYKEAIEEEFQEQNPDHLHHVEPTVVHFFLWRNVEKYESTGRSGHGKIVDATNCQKSLEDALQKLLYDNDRDNVEVMTRIVEQGTDVVPFILIHISFDQGIPRKVSDVRNELTRPSVSIPSNVLPEDRGSVF